MSRPKYTYMDINQLTRRNRVWAVDLSQEIPPWPVAMDLLGIRPMILPKRDSGVSGPKRTVSQRTKIKVCEEIIADVLAEMARRRSCGTV